MCIRDSVKSRLQGRNYTWRGRKCFEFLYVHNPLILPYRTCLGIRLWDRYNAFMSEQDQYLPDSNRIGLLTSTILLAMALTRIIPSPEFNFELQLPGFFLTFPFNINTALSIL